MWLVAYMKPTVLHPRNKQLERLVENSSISGFVLAVVCRFFRRSESKITTLVLGWVEDSMVRSDNPDFGVAGSFWPCAFVSIVW